MSGGRVEGAGVELAFEEEGAGRAVLLVHGTAQTRATWRATVEALGTDLRVLSYDRRGYGESGAPQPFLGTTVEEQAEDAAILLQARDAAPALLCGHSFGAIVCLDLVLRHPDLAGGAVLIEPPLWSLSTAGAELLGELREEIEAAARRGGPGAAVDALIEGVAGSEVLGRLAADELAAIHASGRAVFADFAAATAWHYSRRELRSLELPVHLVRGARSLGIQAEVLDGLSAAIPHAGRHELDAGHMAHLDAPDALAALLRRLAPA